MRNILVIAERELKTYFISPVAYVVLTIFILVSGMFFSFFMNGVDQEAKNRAMAAAQSGQPPQPLDMPGEVSKSLFGVLSLWVLPFMLPMITMALFSEEKKRGTIELLLTAPITDLQVVLGKFLAAAAFYTIMLLTTGVELLTLYIYSSPASGPILSAYLGLLLYGLAILSVGMFISTLTENQIISAILSYGIILILLLLYIFTQGASDGLRFVLSYLSVFSHIFDFIAGVVATSHIIFYLSLILVGLFLTYRSLDSLRWRG